MLGRIVGDSVSRSARENADRSAGEYAHGVKMVTSPSSCTSVDVSSPGRAGSGVIGESILWRRGVGGFRRSGRGGRGFCRMRVWRDLTPALAASLVVSLEALARIAEFGKVLKGTYATRAREGRDDFPVFGRRHRVFERRQAWRSRRRSGRARRRASGRVRPSSLAPPHRRARVGRCEAGRRVPLAADCLNGCAQRAGLSGVG